MKEQLLLNERQKKLSLIEDYDKSQGVNSFVLNGQPVWLDKATRVGLVNSLNAEKSEGLTMTSLWLDNVQYVLPIELAQQMLTSLEVYAKQCYNITEQHKAYINNETDFIKVRNYNYTKNYPKRLEFNIDL